MQLINDTAIQTLELEPEPELEIVVVSDEQQKARITTLLNNQPLSILAPTDRIQDYQFR